MGGSVESYYDVVVFEAQSTEIPVDCKVSFYSYQTYNDKKKIYGVMDRENDFVSFAQKVNALTILDNQFMYVKVHSSCDAEFNIVAGGVHNLMEKQAVQLSQEHLYPTFVMQFVPNEDHRIDLFSDKPASVRVFVCPHPYWPIHPDDTTCQQFDTDEIMEELVVNVESQLVDPSLSYLFMTVIPQNSKQG